MTPHMVSARASDFTGHRDEVGSKFDDQIIPLETKENGLMTRVQKCQVRVDNLEKPPNVVE